MVGWLQIVGSCAAAGKREVYQHYYFEHWVPQEFRRRLAEETHRAGKLLPAAYEKVAVLDPDPAAEESRVGGRSGWGVLHSLATRLPWLLTGFAGGAAAAVVLYFFLKR